MLNSHSLDGVDGQAHIRHMEIRAMAIQAAATLFANRATAKSKYGAIGVVLEHARTIENYIENGEIPQDADA